MKDCSAYDVEGKSNAADNEDELRILDLCDSSASDRSRSLVDHTLQRDEAFNGLEEDADSKGEEEDSIEECTQKLSSLPPKGQLLGCRFAF